MQANLARGSGTKQSSRDSRSCVDLFGREGAAGRAGRDFYLAILIGMDSSQQDPDRLFGGANNVLDVSNIIIRGFGFSSNIDHFCASPCYRTQALRGNQFA
jgi:hypothetical protein